MVKFMVIVDSQRPSPPTGFRALLHVPLASLHLRRPWQLHSLTHKLSHTLSHTHALTLSPSHSLSNTLSHSPLLSLSLTRSLSNTLTLSAGVRALLDVPLAALHPRRPRHLHPHHCQLRRWSQTLSPELWVPGFSPLAAAERGGNKLKEITKCWKMAQANH